MTDFIRFFDAKEEVMSKSSPFKKVLLNELTISVHSILSKKSPGAAKAISKTVKDALQSIVKKFGKRLKEEEKELRKKASKKKSVKSAGGRRTKPVKKKARKAVKK